MVSLVFSPPLLILVLRAYTNRRLPWIGLPCAITFRSPCFDNALNNDVLVEMQMALHTGRNGTQGSVELSTDALKGGWECLDLCEDNVRVVYHVPDRFMRWVRNQVPELS